MGTIRSTAANRHCQVSAQIDAHLDAVGRDDRNQERIDALVANWLNEPAKCRLADEYRNGCLDDEVYSQTHFALAELGSLDWRDIVAFNWPEHVHAVMHRVQSVALRYYQERVDELTQRAIAELDRQRKEADEAETEISMMLEEDSP
jgi:hypothetical protein